MNSATDRYAVMGHPVSHSLSPRIHGMFARQTGQQLSYEALLAPLDGFEKALEAFERAGGKGLNVTLPFKQVACALMHRLSPRAERAGAVNTILLEVGGRRLGHNTDGAGLVRDLKENLSLAIAGSELLLLGAGGAARGVIEPLLEERPARLVVANRTLEKAQRLASHFAPLGHIEYYGLDELNGQRFDLVINCTSAGITGELPPLPPKLLRRGGVCYDMVYGAKATPFLDWAQAHSARLAVDGIGMLVEQAAEAFWLWRGIRPKTASVIESLRRPEVGASSAAI